VAHLVAKKGGAYRGALEHAVDIAMNRATEGSRLGLAQPLPAKKRPQRRMLEKFCMNPELPRRCASHFARPRPTSTDLAAADGGQRQPWRHHLAGLRRARKTSAPACCRWMSSHPCRPLPRSTSRSADRCQCWHRGLPTCAKVSRFVCRWLKSAFDRSRSLSIAKSPSMILHHPYAATEMCLRREGLTSLPELR